MKVDAKKTTVGVMITLTVEEAEILQAMLLRGARWGADEVGRVAHRLHEEILMQSGVHADNYRPMYKGRWMDDAPTWERDGR